MSQRRPTCRKASCTASAEVTAVKKAPAAGIAPAMPLAGAVSLVLPALLFLPVIKDDLCLKHTASVIAGIVVSIVWTVMRNGGQVVIVSGMPA